MKLDLRYLGTRTKRSVNLACNTFFQAMVALKRIADFCTAEDQRKPKREMKEHSPRNAGILAPLIHIRMPYICKLNVSLVQLEFIVRRGKKIEIESLTLVNSSF